MKEYLDLTLSSQKGTDVKCPSLTNSLVFLNFLVMSSLPNIISFHKNVLRADVQTSTSRLTILLVESLMRYNNTLTNIAYN